MKTGRLVELNEVDDCRLWPLLESIRTLRYQTIVISCASTLATLRVLKVISISDGKANHEELCTYRSRSPLQPAFC